MSNNPPEIQVGMSKEDCEFLIKSCEANVNFAASQILAAEFKGDPLPESLQVKLAEQARRFQKIQELLESAM